MTTFQSAQQDAQPNYSNGNGNGHGKIFNLKPATDPDTLAVLDARRNLLADPRLTRAAKAFGCEVFDRALNPYGFLRKGVVAVSDTIFADHFRVSKRSVYNWKRAVESGGYIWTSQQFRSNMWPLTQYHLTCLHPRRNEAKTDQDGTYGAGGERRRPDAPLGARKGVAGQSTLPLAGSRQPPPESKTAVLQGISALDGKKFPVSPETVCGSHPKPIAGETRNGLRVTPETVCGRDPQRFAGESRNGLRATAEANCQHIESQSTVLRDSKSGEGDPPPEFDLENALKVWRKTLDGMFPSKIEKLRNTIRAHRQRATGAGLALCDAKIRILSEIIEGPLPEFEAPRAKPVSVEAIAKRQPTPEEIEESKRFLEERRKRKVSA